MGEPNLRTMPKNKPCAIPRPPAACLTDFMSSGACMILALQRDDAVNTWRKTIGATNHEEAETGTIRKDFATNIQENAVHGSDSNENAEKEAAAVS